MLLLRSGHPAAVIVELECWTKAEFAAWEEAPRLGLTGVIATVDSDPASPVHNCADLRIVCRPEDFVVQLAASQTVLVAGR